MNTQYEIPVIYFRYLWVATMEVYGLLFGYDAAVISVLLSLNTVFVAHKRWIAANSLLGLRGQRSDWFASSAVPSVVVR